MLDKPGKTWISTSLTLPNLEGWASLEEIKDGIMDVLNAHKVGAGELQMNIVWKPPSQNSGEFTVIHVACLATYPAELREDLQSVIRLARPIKQARPG